MTIISKSGVLQTGNGYNILRKSCVIHRLGGSVIDMKNPEGMVLL